MHKIYLLLRNNKQTGPHSLEELAALSLKPTDLIWIDGKSAGWSNPQDIEDLKAYVPHAVVPDPSQKPHTRKELALNAPATEIAELKPEKISAKHIYVRMPGGMPASSAALSANESFSETEETPEEKLEKKAEELRRRAEAFAQGKKELKEDTELDTKYTRSLDDIKNEYTQWLSEQRKKKKFILGKKPMVLVAVALFIISSGYMAKQWFAGSISTTTTSSITQQSKTKKLPTFSNDAAQENTATGKTEDEGTQQVQHVIGSFTGDNMTNDEINASSSTITTKEEQPEDVPVEFSNQSRVAIEKVPEKIVPITESQVTKAPPVYETKPIAAPTKKATLSLTEQIDVSGTYAQPIGKSGLKEFAVKVQNNSNQTLKVVAVDLLYYKENNNLLQKKTLYFSNVQPGEVVTATAPGHKKAVEAAYRLGLVSSEEGAIYFARQ